MRLKTPDGSSERMKTRAYLDIETTGLNRKYCDLTVVGIAFERNGFKETVQLYGCNINRETILKALYGVDTIYTYNGSRFDLPFLTEKLKIDLKNEFQHRDLMYDCWKQNLKGGLKIVEQKLGIQRRLKDIDGFMAVRLWWDYVNTKNESALKTLLDYNKEDMVNLIALRNRLNIE